MFGLSNFIITEFLLIFYSLVTNVLYSYKITQYDTNNNYYIRMYIDKKRLPHIGMEVPCILFPIHTIYYLI